MSIVDTNLAPTAAGLLAMPEGDRFELVRGHLVEKAVGFKSNRIAGRLLQLLLAFVAAHKLGWVLPGETGYQCFPDEPEKVRKPDVSFVSFQRLPVDQEPEGHCRVAPDLAVEVVSPHDLSEDVAAKANEYLQAGVRLVWVVHPRTRQVEVHRPGGGLILNEQDELTGEEAVPGFRCRVAELFAVPGSPASPA